MLVEDRSAFIEQLEVADAGRRATKRRRRVTQLRLEVLEVEWEVGVAVGALQELERQLAAIDLATGSIARGLLRDRRARSLERELAFIRKRLDSKRAELDAKRQRLGGLEQRTEKLDAARRAKLFRLHSSKHHLECSERRFARIARSQSELPILVGRQDGRRWWWFLDRFWWDDNGLSAEDVRTIVLEADLDRKQRSDALAKAQAAILGGEHVAAAPLPPAAQVVRFAVWCRDKGRCADCGTSARVAFDRILPFDQGGSDAPPNIELRCEPCKERRVANEARARVARAQVTAATHFR
jgi:hypothetical protein